MTLLEELLRDLQLFGLPVLMTTDGISGRSMEIHEHLISAIKGEVGYENEKSCNGCSDYFGAHSGDHSERI